MGLPELIEIRAVAGLLLVLATTSSACDRSLASPVWGGSVDTLPNGAVLVRNPEVPLWDSLTAWKLVEELRIGSVDGDGPDLLTSVYGAHTDALGRIWILERQTDQLKIFDANGMHVRSIGRDGSGPGEFRDAIGLAADPNGLVWIVDPGNARYALFDTAGTFITSYPRPVAGYSVPWPGLIDSQGRLFDRAFSRRPDGFAGTALLQLELYREQLQATDTLFVPEPATQLPVFTANVPGGSMTVDVPFAPSFHWALDARGYLWVATSSELKFYQTGFAGDTTRIIERAYAPVSVSAAEERAAIEALDWFTRQGGRIDPSRFPDTKPAFASFSVDRDGYLWVRPTLPGDGIPVPDDVPGLRLVEYDIFDPDGRYLGRLQNGPPRFVLRGNRMIGWATDELGVTWVLRYRIEGRPAH